MIERPASVVKELLENSIDAQATQIKIEIEQGGKHLIRIRDDGLGIHPEDLTLAVSSHATSKIHTFEDLFSITSLGFRGEALASIAAISTLKISSCKRDQEIAAQIEVTGGSDEVISKIVSHPPGTTVEVHKLFFNTPARRKFLRSDQTEFSHIETMVQRIALSHFACGVNLTHQNKVIFNLAAATDLAAKERRVTKLFGQAFMREAYHIDSSASGLRLWGWLALPNFLRSQTDLQYFYINGRMVRDKLISHAIRKAYQELLFEGRHPTYVLHLEIDPHELDVNVHPTKHEVRFQEARLVHDFIFSRINEVIQGESVVRKIAEEPAEYHYRPLPSPASGRGAGGEGESENEKTSALSPAPLPQAGEGKKFSAFFGNPIGLFRQEYLLTDHTNGLMCIHLPTAQRIIFSMRYKQALVKNNLDIQPLLFPQRIQLEENSVDCLEHYSEQLALFGLMIERIASDWVIVRELPKLLTHADLKNLFKKLAESWLKKNDLLITPEIIADFAFNAEMDFDLSKAQKIVEELVELGFEKITSGSPLPTLIYKIFSIPHWERVG